MALESLAECPLCGNSSFVHYIQTKDYLVSHETFSIVQCNQCHFTLTNPRPTSSTISQYYESQDYVSHSGSSQGLINSLYLVARRFTLRWKAGLVKKHLKEGQSILDFGCGTGEFLYECQKKGFKISGVEPSENVKSKHKHLNINTIHPELPPSNTFDLITLWHVLEHIHHFKEQLIQLKSHLNPSGLFFIAVPNPLSADAKKYKQFWAGYDVPRHLWHFSTDNIKSLLDLVGLHLLEIVPMKLDAYYVSLLSEKYKTGGTLTLGGMLSAFASGMMSNHKAVSSNNYSSLIYIARA